MTDYLWRCTVCGRVGTVGRCCGEETRERVNMEHLLAENERLRAEVERLRADLAESDELRDNLRQLLTRTAAALKGEPPEGTWHSWHDLPEKATQLGEALRLAAQLVDELDGLVGESDGVSGLHLNGDVATWDELLPGGRFERLSSLDDLRAALAQREEEGERK